MFANTITLTIGGSSKILNRVNQDNYGSEYTYISAIESISMKIRHTNDKIDADGLIMKRHNVFLERIIYPTPTANMQKHTYTVTLRSSKYEDPALSVALAAAVNAWLGASTNAALTDLSTGVN